MRRGKAKEVFRASSPRVEPRSLCGRVEGAEATELATPRAFPAPALTQDRAGQQGADGEPHLPGSAARSREHRPVGFCAASPVRCPFISGPAGQAGSLTSCVCAACLPNHPSSLPLHSFPRLITPFPELWKDPRMESSTKMLIVRELKKNQLFVNARSLCARNRAAAGGGGGGGGWLCS